MVSYKELLSDGKTHFGTYVRHPGDYIVDVLKLSGIDNIVLDLEHDMLTFTDLMSLIRACEAVGVATVVRVADMTPSSIFKALDMGASCIKVPGIATAEQARQVVAYCKYPPEGVRGVCTGVRANGYGIDRVGCFARANDNVTISVIVEDLEGIANLEEIVAVEGIDVITIGNADLSARHQAHGQTYDPRVMDSVAQVVELCRKYGKHTTLQVRNMEDISKYDHIDGIDLIVLPPPAYLLLQKTTDFINHVKAHRPELTYV